MKHPVIAGVWVLIAIVLGAGVGVPGAHAQDAVPAEALARIKAATVYVRAMIVVPELAEPVEATGSGFVVDATGTDVWVATNSHVVTSDMKESKDIRLVFYSGTSQEVTAPATIVARDAGRDLAILKAVFPGPAPLPTPLDLRTGAPLQETATVYIFGFPFGKDLAEREGNPEITVGRGSVSSIRRDAFDRVVHVQVNGDLNPGNSGGPVVDTSGRLAGIAVTHVRSTQIGYAIPAGSLLDMLQGRAIDPVLHERERHGPQRVYGITADLADPRHRLLGVELLLVAKDKLGATPRADRHGAWGPIAPEAAGVPLTLNGRTAMGTVTLRAAAQESAPYWVQLRCTRSAGEVVYGAPLPFHVAPTSDWLTALEAAGPGAGAPPGGPTDDPPAYTGRVKAPSATVDPTAVGRPEPGGQALADAPEGLAGATVTALKVDAANVLPAMAWSTDGRSFYTLGLHTGVLRKIGLKSLTVERQVDLGGMCTGLARSGAGLVVTLQAKDEVCVVDGESLEVKSRWHVPDLLEVAAAAPAEVAWAACGSPRLRRIDALNLRDGKIARSYSPEVLRTLAAAGLPHEGTDRAVQTVDDLRVTPDGKYLFMVSARVLHRFSIHGTALAYEESGPTGVGRQERIEVSPDSRYVALVNGGGDVNSPRYPALGKYGTYVFRVDDLQTPVAALRQGAFPACLAMCKATHRLYTQNSDVQLMVFKPDGTEEREYCLSGPGDLTEQILPDTEGRGVLVLTQSQLMWVEFKP